MSAASITSKCTALSLCETLPKEELDKLKERLISTVFSHARFLMPGQSLSEIAKKDSETLKEIGITYDQIGDKLKSIIIRIVNLYKKESPKEMEKSGEYLSITRFKFVLDSKFEVRVISYFRGLQECPFQEYTKTGCEIEASCYDIKITNKDLGEEIKFGGLLPHLFKAHEFAEGEGCGYRLDPAKAAKVLQLEKGIEYGSIDSITPSASDKAEVDKESGLSFSRTLLSLRTQALLRGSSESTVAPSSVIELATGGAGTDTKKV